MPDHYQNYLNDPTWNPPSGPRTDSARPMPIAWEDILPMNIGAGGPTFQPRNTGVPQRRSHVRRQDRPVFGNRRPPCTWEREQQRQRRRAREARLDRIPYELRQALLEPDLHGHHLQAEIQRLASEKDYVGLWEIWKAASRFERYQEEERQEQARRDYFLPPSPDPEPPSSVDEDNADDDEYDEYEDDDEDEDAEYEWEYEYEYMPPLRRVRARQEQAPSDRPPTPYPRPSAPPIIPGLEPLPPISMDLPERPRDRQALQPPETSENSVYTPFFGLQDGDGDGLAAFEREQAVAMLTEERRERTERRRRRRGAQLGDDEDTEMSHFFS